MDDFFFDNANLGNFTIDFVPGGAIPPVANPRPPPHHQQFVAQHPGPFQQQQLLAGQHPGPYQQHPRPGQPFAAALPPCPRRKILMGVSGTAGAVHIPALTNKLIETDDLRLVCEKTCWMYFRRNGLHNRIKSYTDDDVVSTWCLEKTNLHEKLAEWTEVLIILPCSSDILTKVALGISGDLLTNTVKSYRKKVHLCLDMDAGSLCDDNTNQYIQKMKSKKGLVKLPELRLINDTNATNRIGSVPDLIKWIDQAKNQNQY